ncbi:hypothetical protein PPL_02861 [Heterostelium album PN500]|uniref:Uncharacterized protein n=1 Tax=Heterostelium pallidum (strain ATCC 26659 / Pp 5 / PN500) TaxID=670386 RepID=D3B395_HETP5|nr:hypothetical protein PPL_02861 [Heterostelium album PN500]EFA83793.1 hypothetical protein PPL_02861 [Heterostelium album PN500]|eukprot:XP_020435910.1 hypothetical protein PPL_02861 [Heterostelium album PN500]
MESIFDQVQIIKRKSEDDQDRLKKQRMEVVENEYDCQPIQKVLMNKNLLSIILDFTRFILPPFKDRFIKIKIGLDPPLPAPTYFLCPKPIKRKAKSPIYFRYLNLYRTPYDIIFMLYNKMFAAVRKYIEDDNLLTFRSKLFYKTDIPLDIFKILYQRLTDDFEENGKNEVIRKLLKKKFDKDFIIFCLSTYTPTNYSFKMANLLMALDYGSVELIQSFFKFPMDETDNDFHPIQLLQRAFKYGLEMFILLESRYRERFLSSVTNQLYNTLLFLVYSYDIKVIDYFFENYQLTIDVSMLEKIFYCINVERSAETQQILNIFQSHCIDYKKPVSIDNDSRSCDGMDEEGKENSELPMNHFEFNPNTLSNQDKSIQDIVLNQVGNNLPFISDFTDMELFMKTHYQFVLEGHCPFLPEKEWQLPIIKYLVDSKVHSKNNSTMIESELRPHLLSTTIFAIRKGFSEMVEYMVTETLARNPKNIGFSIRNNIREFIQEAIYYCHYEMAKYLISVAKKLSLKNTINFEVFQAVHDTSDPDAFELLIKNRKLGIKEIIRRAIRLNRYYFVGEIFGNPRFSQYLARFEQYIPRMATLIAKCDYIEMAEHYINTPTTNEKKRLFIYKIQRRLRENGDWWSEDLFHEVSCLAYRYIVDFAPIQYRLHQESEEESEESEGSEESEESEEEGWLFEVVVVVEVVIVVVTVVDIGMFLIFEF